MSSLTLVDLQLLSFHCVTSLTSTVKGCFPLPNSSLPLVHARVTMGIGFWDVLGFFGEEMIPAYFHTSDMPEVDGQMPPDFEKRVLERAYFQYINGVSEDQAYNYAEALRIELGQRPDL